ncbi:MAG: hypothetical protein VKL39_04270 [Leptolyngbyaceae bacterium]|nr:hypothetical protein [Leptolyngbyaceae bacterium]
MDITASTKELIQKVQQLKATHPDQVSQVFIDFYCQCQQGIDYLFPVGVKETIRLFDVLQWFCNCVDQKKTPTLIQLMWNDVVGPSLEEYQDDERIESSLLTLFQGGDLQEMIRQWDLDRRADGSVNLKLRTLLNDIHTIEITHRNKHS